MKKLFGYQAAVLIVIFLNCWIAYGEAPYLGKAPQFAKASQNVPISAYAPGAEKVAVTWEGPLGSGQAMMALDSATGLWKGEILGETVGGPSLLYSITSYVGDKAEESPKYTLFVSSKFTAITPKPMKLIEKVVVSKSWNGGPDAFGIYQNEGANTGPASIAYSKGIIYLLDNVNRRIPGFGKDGKAVSTVALPEADMTDMVVDQSTSSILAISQYSGAVNKVMGSEATLLVTIKDLNRLVFPAKFIYSRATDTLFAAEPLSINLVPVMCSGVAVNPKNRSGKERLSVAAEFSGKNLVLGLKGGKEIISIAMDKDITGVEEVVTDYKGFIWIIYTLNGDNRMCHIARVDTSEYIAEVAEAKDVWFYTKATRHMAAMENGIVLFASDQKEGRIISFEYGGGSLQ